MSFSRLANELLLNIVDRLELSDINSVVQLNRRYRDTLDMYLYECENKRVGRGDVMLWAIECGVVETARKSMKFDSWGYARTDDDFRYDPLQLAARNNRPEMVKLTMPLLSDSEDYKSALLYFSIKDGMENVEVIDLLLAAGCDPMVHPPGSSDMSTFHHAVWYGCDTVVDRFLKKSCVDVNDKVTGYEWLETFDYSPLMLAAHGGHTRLVTRLLYHGADAYHRTPNGETALSVAVRQGHAGAAEVLLPYEGLFVGAIVKENKTILVQHLNSLYHTEADVVKRVCRELFKRERRRQNRDNRIWFH